MGRVIAQPIETIELVDTGISEVITDLLLVGRMGLTTETEISNPKFVTPEQFTFLSDTIAGTASGNKVMVLDSDLNITGINDVSLNNNIHKYSSNEVRSIEKTSNVKNNTGNIIILPDVNNIENDMYLIEQSFNDLGGRSLPTLIKSIHKESGNPLEKLSIISNGPGNNIKLQDVDDIEIGMFLTTQSDHEDIVATGSNGASSDTITITSITGNKQIKVGMYLFEQTNDSRQTPNTLIERGGALVTNVSGTLPPFIITIANPQSGSSASPVNTEYKFTSNDGRSLPTIVTGVNIVAKTVTVESKSSLNTISGTSFTFQKLPNIELETNS